MKRPPLPGLSSATGATVLRVWETSVSFGDTGPVIRVTRSDEGQFLDAVLEDTTGDEDVVYLMTETEAKRYESWANAQEEK